MVVLLDLSLDAHDPDEPVDQLGVLGVDLLGCPAVLLAQPVVEVLLVRVAPPLDAPLALQRRLQATEGTVGDSGSRDGVKFTATCLSHRRA